MDLYAKDRSPLSSPLPPLPPPPQLRSNMGMHLCLCEPMRDLLLTLVRAPSELLAMSLVWTQNLNWMWEQTYSSVYTANLVPSDNKWPTKSINVIDFLVSTLICITSYYVFTSLVFAYMLVCEWFTQMQWFCSAYTQTLKKTNFEGRFCVVHVQSITISIMLRLVTVIQWGPTLWGSGGVAVISLPFCSLDRGFQSHSDPSRHVDWVFSPYLITWVFPKILAGLLLPHR